MAYLSISTRPGKLVREVSDLDRREASAYFMAEMPNHILLGMFFDRATAAQWAAELTKFAEEGK